MEDRIIAAAAHARLLGQELRGIIGTGSDRIGTNEHKEFIKLLIIFIKFLPSNPQFNKEEYINTYIKLGITQADANVFFERLIFANFIKLIGSDESKYEISFENKTDLKKELSNSLEILFLLYS